MNNLIKKIALTTLLGLTSLSAEGNHYLSGELQYLMAEDNNVLGIQPADELIGSELTIFKVGYGFVLPKDRNDIFSGSRFGLYGAFSNTEDMDIAFGLDFVLKNENMSFYGFRPYFSGNLGLGVRDDKGSRKRTSTSVNKYTYVSTNDLSALNNPDTAIFQENTTWIETGFAIGVDYTFSNNVDLEIGYIYQKRSYEVNYVLESSPEIENSLNFDQRYNGIQVNVSYDF